MVEWNVYNLNQVAEFELCLQWAVAVVKQPGLLSVYIHAFTLVCMHLIECECTIYITHASMQFTCWGGCNLSLTGHVSASPNKWRRSGEGLSPVMVVTEANLTCPQRLTHTLFTCRNIHNLSCKKSTSPMVWNKVFGLDESLFLQAPGEGTRGHSEVW